MSEFEHIKSIIKRVMPARGRNMTKKTMPLENCPDCGVKPGEIHPYMKRGFEYAAKIAIAALKLVEKDG